MGRKGGKGGQQEAADKDFKFDLANPQQREQVFDASLLQHFQQRLTGLVGQSSGYLESLPKAVQQRVKALKHLHSKHVDLEKQFNAEVAEIEKKYMALYKPLYERRSTIISGASEPSAEELVDKEPTEKKEEEGKKEETAEEKDIKGIPEFWLNAIRHHPDFGAMTTERDAEALKHLVDLKVISVENEPHSFTIEFTFSDNEFFEDKVINKTYILKEDDGEVVYDHVDCTEIKWKPGKNLCVKKVTRQQKGKGGRRGGRGGSKPQSVTVEQPCESFFNFFNPEAAYEMIVGAGMEEEEEDEYGPEGYQDFLEADYELGLEFKEKLIPHGVEWFTGDAAMGFMDEYDVDEDDLEDDEEEEEDDEDEAPVKPKKGGNAPAPQAGQAAQPECKQQ